MSVESEAAERLAHIREIGELQAELARELVSALHGEPVETMDHVTLIAAGDIPLPPADLLWVAAAEVTVDAAHRYIGILEGMRAGDADMALRCLRDAVALYLRGAGERLRVLAVDRLAVADLAAEYIGVFEKAVRMNPAIDEAYCRVVKDAQTAYGRLREYVTQRAALAA
jgi:hypothetical protein